MSSHHVVRDDQEPALFVLKPYEVPVEVLHELLEWSPIVLVTIDSLAWLQDLGIKTNTVFIQKGHLKSDLNLEQDIDAVSIQHDNIFEDVLSYLTHRNVKALNVVSDVNNGFLDSLNDINIKVMIYTSHFKWFKVKDTFKKWVRSDQTFYSYIKTYVALNEEEIQWDKLGRNYLLRSEGEGFLFFDHKESFWLGEQIKP